MLPPTMSYGPDRGCYATSRSQPVVVSRCPILGCRNKKVTFRHLSCLKRLLDENSVHVVIPGGVGKTYISSLNCVFSSSLGTDHQQQPKQRISLSSTSSQPQKARRATSYTAGMYANQSKTSLMALCWVTFFTSLRVVVIFY